MKQVAASIIACLLLFMFAFSASAAGITGEKATEDATDYAVTDSKVAQDGKFVGLAIDEMNEGDKTADVRWTMVTQAQPTIEYGAITLVREGKYMYLTKTSSTGHNPTWTTWSTVSENSWDASNTGYYECGYTVTVTAGDTATIRVKLSPDDPAL